jgi:RNA polymerase sigma-70 factor (ECF subfamily)
VTTGNGLSFEDLVGPELPKLYRLAYRLTGKVGDAEDLVQDVLIKAYERRRELTSFDALGAWLGRVLYNQFIDEKRRDGRWRLRLIPYDEHTESVEEVEADAAPATPGEVWERSALREALGRALDTLSLEHRSVVLLHDAEGYTLEEIQTITGVPLGTLKSRLHRARRRLRRQLGGAGGTFPESGSL